MRRWRPPAADVGARQVALILISLAAIAAPLPARAASLGASLAAASDYRYRGVSLSDQRPVVSLDLTGDWANGVYVGATALGVATAHSGFRALGLQEYAGYARRFGPELSGEVGVINANYTEAYVGGSAAGNHEVYVGVSGRRLSGRLFYSPNYFRQGYATLYGELNGAVRPRPGWRLSGHVGVLTPVSGGSDERTQVDWRLGLAREVRALTLEAAVTGAHGGDRDRDRGRDHERKGETLVVSASWAF